MNMTKNSLPSIVTIVAMFGLGACGAEKPAEETTQAVELEKTTPTVSFKPQSGFEGTTVKPGAPFSISYRIIGTPIVGSPVTVDLRVDSSLGPRPVTLDYRINDASAMMLAESQPDSVTMEAAANESSLTQQVTIIPQRDGRLYLNVSASFETENGTQSTVAAIPVQVGSGPRQLEDNGELQTDENGEAVRVLSSEE